MLTVIFFHHCVGICTEEHDQTLQGDSTEVNKPNRRKTEGDGQANSCPLLFINKHLVSAFIKPLNSSKQVCKWQTNPNTNRELKKKSQALFHQNHIQKQKPHPISVKPHPHQTSHPPQWPLILWWTRQHSIVFNEFIKISRISRLFERKIKKKEISHQSAKYPVHVWETSVHFKWSLVLHLLKWDWRDAGIPTCVQTAGECYTPPCPALHTHTHTLPLPSLPLNVRFLHRKLHHSTLSPQW